MPKRIMKPVICMVSLMAIIGARPVLAMDHIRQYVPQAKKVGQARMSVMIWDLYDATLFAPEGRWSGEEPFALQLTYLRDLKGDKIADRSVEEMRKQGRANEVKLATWHTQMRRIFPDVSNGDVLSGIFTRDGQTIFYKGNDEIGRINDAEFSKQFFSIWLSPETSAPEVRTGLLGQSAMKGQNQNENFERYSSNGSSRIH